MEDRVSRVGRKHTVRELATGGGLGVLVGLLVGLTVADVVASVLAGLVALLGAVFGLKQPAAEADGAAHADGSHAWRIAAFGIFASIALLAGIVMRTHGYLGESVTAQVAQWEAAGLKKDQALALVALQRTGVAAKDQQVVDAKVLTRVSSGALFAGEAGAECPRLEPGRYADGTEWLRAFERAGGGWQGVAVAARDLDAAQKAAIARAAWTLACAQ